MYGITELFRHTAIGKQHNKDVKDLYLSYVIASAILP